MASPHAHPQRWLLLAGAGVFAGVGVAVYFSDLHRAYLFAVIVAWGAFRLAVGLRLRARD